MTEPPPTYGALLDALRAIQDEARFATGSVRERRRAHLYWDMGAALIAAVDCGFGRHVTQRFRLRGIDAAEMYSLAGRRARDWLVERLAGAPTLVVASRRTDVYGRYPADLFYLPGEADPARVLAEGSYLNRELLELDSVRRYDG